LKLQFERLLTDEPLERRDPRFVFLDHVGRGGVFIEAAGLILMDPDPDEVTREIVAFGQTMRPCIVSPSRYSCTTWRLNATLWVRRFAMASILRKPGSPVNSSVQICPTQGAHSKRGSSLAPI